MDECGNSLEPNYNEKLTAEEACSAARKSGSDYFHQDIPVPADYEEHNFLGDQKLSSLLIKNDLEYEHDDSENDIRWIDRNINNY